MHRPKASAKKRAVDFRSEVRTPAHVYPSTRMEFTVPDGFGCGNKCTSSIRGWRKSGLHSLSPFANFIKGRFCTRDKTRQWPRSQPTVRQPAAGNDVGR